jgi:hypothetical protein
VISKLSIIKKNYEIFEYGINGQEKRLYWKNNGTYHKLIWETFKLEINIEMYYK